MSDRKMRVPWPELSLALLGGILIVVGLVFSLGSVGALGIPIAVVSVLAALFTLPLSLLHSRGQFVSLFVGTILSLGGLWYGMSQQEDAEIFSPALLAFVGAALILSALCNLIARRG
ncbi:hypothetical protein EML15_04100 [Corynebacterium sp. sy017]|uniref:DUF2583 domain-containing protein n=1 Tax=unclassified Corynebacterium TaxID=2624378 RepID=UPI0011868588|nr:MULTISPECIES: DUF2583 domain-containing protein [unclassified Corynebacterium]MBP3088330.1 hypothetical protein [Corynebacterium sp. sy017]QDZ41783.1 DUF2583 domain-containing protein [Corynebacterium sp. sy039]TSD91650.1 hypothetical protein ELY17_04100 [Corynebacterium sp. SY003]